MIKTRKLISITQVIIVLFKNVVVGDHAYVYVLKAVHPSRK